MKQHLRRFLGLFVIVTLFGLGASPTSPSFAAGYPDRPIQLIIPNVAGAMVDIGARMLAAEMEKILGGKIIPINKPGVGSVLGTDLALRSRKDGYTLLYSSNTAFALAPACTPDVVKYDPGKDAEPLGLHYLFPQTITVRADAPWKTFQELIEYAKKNPGKIRVSTTGSTTGPHLIVEMISVITGAKLTHVPFEGGESVITAVLGGHVEATCDTVAKVKPHVEAGKMRTLLITNKMPGFADVPTIADLGYKATLYGGWFGMYAPAGIPEDVKKLLLPAVEKAVTATKPKIDATGNICEYRPPSEQRRMAEEEYRRFVEIAIKIGLRKQ